MRGEVFLSLFMEKGKRGAGQFEMVISFVFFFGFVLFLFIFLTPEDTTTLSGAVINELHDSFEERVYTNLSNLFLRAEYSGSNSCFTVDLPENVFKYDLDSGNSRVVLLSGDDVDSDLNSGILSVSNDDIYFRVSISPEFEDYDLYGCEELSDYVVGGVVERRVLSYSSLRDLSSDYYSDYEELRSRLGVPAIYDFAIVFEDMDDLTMMPSSGIPDGVEVMARDFVFEVLKSDGSFSNERVNFRIW